MRDAVEHDARSWQPMVARCCAGRRRKAARAGRRRGRATRPWAGRSALGAYPPPARPRRGAGAGRGLLLRPDRLPGPGRASDLAGLADRGHRRPRDGGAAGGRHRPEANIILATGRVFDVLDVPAAARARRPGPDGRGPDVKPGPVALSAGDRALFFVATRGAPADEDEWWSCHLDCEPDDVRRGRRAALALPGQLRARPAVPAARRGRGPVAARARQPSAARRAAAARVPGRRLRGGAAMTGERRRSRLGRAVRARAARSCPAG